MDFEFAERRLAKDHLKLKQQRERKVRNRTTLSSAAARKEAQLMRDKAEARRLEKNREKENLTHIQQYMERCVTALTSRSTPITIRFPHVTSIHGEGDKIALPPDALETFMKEMPQDNQGEPWTFRIGILNPDYQFPASPTLKERLGKGTISDSSEDLENEPMEDGDESIETSAFLEELSYKYLSYTHATVVEFTQDEGTIGLPASIAKALLHPSNAKDEQPIVVPTRTVDPAGFTPILQDSDDIDIGKTASTSTELPQPDTVMEDDTTTPGHLAWGAFDVPGVPIELTVVRLPKGKGCTLVPTKEAVSNGFYGLKEVKLVLEQSLIRTRATLSVGDLVHTWHRGKKFDLVVQSVTPADYSSVSCINTDIEVELGPPESSENTDVTAGSAASTATSKAPDEDTSFVGGRTLAEVSSPIVIPPMASNVKKEGRQIEIPLPPEPPADLTDGVCTVQIRGNGVSPGRRRFDVATSTMHHLFAFAASVCGQPASSFQLVTRFPRRVFQQGEDSSVTMADAGIQTGQELFLVERL